MNNPLQILPRLAFLSLLILFTHVAPVQAQSAFHKSKVIFQNDMESALNEALQKFQGDLFIYFYDPHHPAHARMDSVVLADSRLSRYVNSQFSRLAVDVSTPEGRRLMEMYTPNAQHDSPFIAVMSGLYLKHATFHGWEKASAGTRDEFGLTDMGRHWLTLVSMKEYGRPPARPGDAGWGRWSARVKSLVADSRLPITASR